VQAQEGSRTIVDCGLGRIACEHRDFGVASEATLCIRPEFIHLSAGEVRGDNAVNGRIDSKVFVGEAYEVEIRVGEELLLARVDPDLHIEVGHAVGFRLDPAHCLLVSA
jgi:iron(III) transport system ATP-binding protein